MYGARLFRSGVRELSHGSITPMSYSIRSATATRQESEILLQAIRANGSIDVLRFERLAECAVFRYVEKFARAEA
jgi:hypothetical protein